MHISIIDDEKILAEKIRKKLEKQWYTVSIYHSCSDFYDAYSIASDLYIIDLGLWEWSWFDIIKWLRNEKYLYTPIIITSWYSDIEKKVYWLDIWADDYITKPVIPDELLARINVQLRKTQKAKKMSNIMEYWEILFDSKNNIIKLAGDEIILTKKEWQIVNFFIRHKWELISKNEIIHTVWSSEDFSQVSDNTINVTISKLRSKLWPSFKLITRVNSGYVLEE